MTEHTSRHATPARIWGWLVRVGFGKSRASARAYGE